MNKIRFEFDNVNGESLAGLLELPERGGEIAGCAVFAHCFTCGKDSAAASRIAQATSPAWATATAISPTPVLLPISTTW